MPLSSVAVRWPAVWQARIRISARHRREVLPFERQAMKKMKIGLGEWRWMNVLYECDYKCLKLKKIKINVKGSGMDGWM